MVLRDWFGYSICRQRTPKWHKKNQLESADANKVIDNSVIGLRYSFSAALEKAKALMKKGMDQQMNVTVIAEKVNTFEARLKDLLNNSRHSLDNSQAAHELINRSREANVKVRN